MNEPSAVDDQLRARLRAADPAAQLAPADPAEVDRTLRRVVDTDLRETGTRRRSPLTWLVAAAAVVVIGAGVLWWTNDNGSEPGVVAGPSESTSSAATGSTELAAPAASAGRCMVPTAAVVAAQPMAFEATVVSIADGVVTLQPTTVYTGEVGDEVTVTGAVTPLGSIEGEVDFEAGQSYLVAASDGQIRGCGLSGPVSPALKALFEAAFPQ
jgi:hypothetical protein